MKEKVLNKPENQVTIGKQGRVATTLPPSIVGFCGTHLVPQDILFLRRPDAVHLIGHFLIYGLFFKLP